MRYVLILTLIGISATLSACSSTNHASSIDTQIDHNTTIGDSTEVGIKHGDMVVQRKVQIAEHLRELQNQVYYLQDDVYGNDKTGRRGLYGVVYDCRKAVAEKANGGDGKLSFMEARELPADHEPEFKIGLDSKDQLVGVQEEFLKARIERFSEYRATLEKRRDDFEQKRDMCQLELKSKQYDLNAKNGGQ